MNDLIQAVDQALEKSPRVILALAGPPAAGKSTITSTLYEHFGTSAVTLPMDGFHLDNQILDAKGLRARKGAPETFDAAGFINTVKRVAHGEPVFVPEFDRELDLARAGAIEITDQKLIIVEGNYLLFNTDPWRQLADIWTFSVWIDISIEEVEARCVQRWLDHGFDKETATKRARENDVRNAKTVIANRLPADFTISMPNG